MKRKKTKKSKVVRGSRRASVRRTVRRSARPGRPPKGPVNLVMSVDGQPIATDCCCPICADMAARGTPQYTVIDGEMVELPPPPVREMLEVTMRGTPSTYPHLPLEPEPRSVPVGCTVHDFVASLPYFGDHAFRVAFPSGTLRGRVNGEDCDPSQVLRPGDAVEILGEPDPEASRMMERILTDPDRDGS